MPRKPGTKNAAPANSSAATTAASDQFRPGADWFSIAEAAEMLGYPAKTGANRVRAAAKTNATLNNPDAMRAITFAGYNIPPILYFHKNAIEAYRGEIATRPAHSGGRTPGFKTFTVKIPIADVDRLRGLAGDIGLTLIEPAKRASGKGKTAQPAPVVAADAATDIGVNESDAPNTDTAAQ